MKKILTAAAVLAGFIPSYSSADLVSLGGTLSTGEAFAIQFDVNSITGDYNPGTGTLSVPSIVNGNYTISAATTTITDGANDEVEFALTFQRNLLMGGIETSLLTFSASAPDSGLTFGPGMNSYRQWITNINGATPVYGSGTFNFAASPTAFSSLTAVPEPSGIVGLGLFCFAGLFRRRSRR